MASSYNSANFMYKVGLLREFFYLYGRPPKHREKYKGVNIGAWLGTQRHLYRNGKLSFGKIDCITDIDENLLSFESFLKDEYRFGYMVNLLKEFVEENGRAPKEKEKYKNENLGRWFSKVKSYYKNNKLDAKRAELIMNIDKKLLTSSKKQYFAKDFNFMLKLLKEFKLKYGRLPKQRETYKGRNIGTWIGTKRRAYKKGKLTNKQINALNSIDKQILKMR